MNLNVVVLHRLLLQVLENNYQDQYAVYVMVICIGYTTHLVSASKVVGSIPRIKNKGICHCGRPQRSKGKDKKTGRQIYDRECWKCKEQSYHLHKRAYCEHCGFIAIHPVQLDVDHIDGNHKNNNLDNLQTLCANCHRLKTQLNNDHLRGRDGKDQA